MSFTLLIDTIYEWWFYLFAENKRSLKEKKNFMTHKRIGPGKKREKDFKP